MEQFSHIYENEEITLANLNEEIKRRRTFAIISHPDAGKTTLTEKFLLYGGAINLAGSVKGKKQQSMLFRIGWKLKRNVVFLLPLQYYSLTMIIIVLTYLIRRVMKTSQRIPTVHSWLPIRR